MNKFRFLPYAVLSAGLLLSSVSCAPVHVHAPPGQVKKSTKTHPHGGPPGQTKKGPGHPGKKH